MALPGQFMLLHILRRTVSTRSISITFRFPRAAAVAAGTQRHRVFLIIKAIIVAHFQRQKDSDTKQLLQFDS